MLPKIASALARVLDPIRPMARPGTALTTLKSSDSRDGGYGSAGYEKAPGKDASAGREEKPVVVAASDTPTDAVRADEDEIEKPALAPGFQPGLTQVILDLNAHRPERTGSAALTYETGAKDQKKNARLPKGSMLDKKVG